MSVISFLISVVSWPLRISDPCQILSDILKMFFKHLISFCIFILFIALAKSDDSVASAQSSAQSKGDIGTQPVVGAPPPPVGPPHGPGFPGGFGGLGGFFPGLGLGGLGFQKSLDISAGAGYGPFGLGGLGGFGGVPPPPIDGVDPGFGVGGFPGFGGLLGPSYLPSTWLGSALGAKGDLLFPLVIFVFFVVGVWTIVQFLLGIIVPLIASKFSVLKGGFRHKRALTPEEQKEQEVEHLTTAVWEAFEKFGCLKTSACYTGNIVHTFAGADKVKEYEGIIDSMKVVDPEIVSIFKKAAQSGNEDCNKYPCQGPDKKVKGEEATHH